MQRFLLTWPVVVLLAVAGCGQAKPAAVPPTSSTAIPEPATTLTATTKESTAASPSELNAQSPLVATADDGTAEATFQQTLVAFQEGRLDAVFDFLPASYQADVESLVHEFGEKMDAELWSQCFSLLSKTADILKTKKALILGLENVKRAKQLDSIKPHWDAIVSGMQAVATSEVADINNLKHCDVKKFLASGSRLLNGMPLPKFGDVTVTTVNADADTATLSYRESKESELKQVEFVKVEGKWLTKSIANGWSEGVAYARSKLADLPGQVSSLKPQLMQQFEGIGGMLDQLQQAKTSEEFNMAAVPIALSIAIGKGLVEQMMRETEVGRRKGSALNLVINREISETEQTKLKDSVLEAINDPNAEYEIIPNDGKTRFRFTSVVDASVIVAILKKQFVGANVTMDSEKKMIRVELK